jgi:hypothetical protein
MQDKFNTAREDIINVLKKLAPALSGDHEQKYRLATC